MHVPTCLELFISLSPYECSPNIAPFLKLGQDNPQMFTDVLTLSLERGQNDPQMFLVTSPDLATALQPIIGNSPLNKPIIIVKEQPPDSPLVSVAFCFKSSLYQLFGVF